MPRLVNNVSGMEYIILQFNVDYVCQTKFPFHLCLMTDTNVDMDLLEYILIREHLKMTPDLRRVCWYSCSVVMCVHVYM